MDDSKYATKDDLRDMIDDFKQYISAEFRVRDTRMDQMEARMDKNFEQIDKKFDRIDDKFDDVDEKLDEILNAVGEDLQRNSARVDDHESRIARLEEKAV